MAGFSVPKEFDDFVTSASDLLSQYKEHSSRSLFQDFLVFRIFLDEGFKPATLKEMMSLRQQIQEITVPLMNKYVWHKDYFRVKVVVPEDGSSIYLGGMLEFGDCVDDEWFVVSLLYDISKKIPRVSISVTDTDGQFLLIEASSADIPEWIGPENSENRVWIKGGDLHIIPLDEAGGRRAGGIDVPSALSALSRSGNGSNHHSTLASPSVQRTLLARTSSAHLKNQAQHHRTAVTVPLKVAQLIAERPELVSAAVSGLCAERTKHSSKTIASMSYFGVSPLVTVSVTLTRALYAQLTFQERFHPPPKFLNSQRVLQKKKQQDNQNYHQQQQQHQHSPRNSESSSGVCWDAASSKSFDIGCRLSCGLELSYQRSLTGEREWRTSRERREKTVSEYMASAGEGFGGSEEKGARSSVVLTVPSADFSSDMIITAANESANENCSGADMMNSFRPVLALSEVVNSSLQETPEPRARRDTPAHPTATAGLESASHNLIEECSSSETSGALDDIVIIEVDPNSAESDHWLYLTPEEFDANMQSRISSVASTVEANTDNMPNVVNTVGSPSGVATAASISCISSANEHTIEEEDGHANQSNKQQSSGGKSDGEGEGVLSGIVSGMDTFMSSFSDYSGVIKGDGDGDEGNGEDEDDDDEDDDDEDDDDEDKGNNTHSRLDLASDHQSRHTISDDITFDSDKLASILASQDAGGDAEGGGNGEGMKEDIEDISLRRLSINGDECVVEDDDRDSFYDSSDDSDDYDIDGEADGESDNEKVDISHEESIDDQEDGNTKERMEAYLEALDSELSTSTLVETFEQQDTDDGSVPSLHGVDVGKNLLKNFLESQASQLGRTGPASNLLSQLGISLPLLPKMNEECDSSGPRVDGSGNEEEGGGCGGDDHQDSSGFMNPDSYFSGQSKSSSVDNSNYFLNVNSLD